MILRDLLKEMDDDYANGGYKSMRDEKPGILAKSDEFTVEVDDDMVHLLDGEQSVRVSMERNIWMDLCKQSCEADE